MKSEYARQDKHTFWHPYYNQIYLPFLKPWLILGFNSTTNSKCSSWIFSKLSFLE